MRSRPEVLIDIAADSNGVAHIERETQRGRGKLIYILYIIRTAVVVVRRLYYYINVTLCCVGTDSQIGTVCVGALLAVITNTINRTNLAAAIRGPDG